MAGEFRFYVLGLVLVSIGVATLTVGMVQDQFILCMLSLLFLLWGGALVEGLTWREFLDEIKARFKRET